jgi:hypothetical protein
MALKRKHAGVLSKRRANNRSTGGLQAIGAKQGVRSGKIQRSLSKVVKPRLEGKPRWS